MTIPTYVAGYPPDGSSLGSTKTTIRGNLDGTFLTFAVDHINNNGQPGGNPAGYHNVIRSVLQSSASAVPTITGINQLFSLATSSPQNGDTQFFQRTGQGGLAQLTGNAASGSNGFFFSSGFLINFGKVLVSGGWPSGNNNIVNLSTPPNIVFPTGIFVVLTTLIGPGTTSGSVEINDISSNTQFKWNFTGSSGASEKGFFWVAIGN